MVQSIHCHKDLLKNLVINDVQYVVDHIIAGYMLVLRKALSLSWTFLSPLYGPKSSFTNQ